MSLFQVSAEARRQMERLRFAEDTLTLLCWIQRSQGPFPDRKQVEALLAVARDAGDELTRLGGIRVVGDLPLPRRDGQLIYRSGTLRTGFTWWVFHSFTGWSYCDIAIILAETV